MAPKTKRIAWDGISFIVPPNWELALYRAISRRTMRIELEDEVAVRLEAEWTRTTKRKHFHKILDACGKSVDALIKNADNKWPIDGLPPSWQATRYQFRDTAGTSAGTELEVHRNTFVTALYLCPRRTLIAYVQIHFPETDGSEADDVTRAIAEGFTRHTDTLVPWEMYDIAFALPRDFFLESTSFGIGSKLMIFRWGRRRFYLWHFSVADRILKDGEPAATWAAAWLNTYARITGIAFAPNDTGGIDWRRRYRLPVRSRDEWGRWCFQYTTGCRHDRDKNQIIVWVFNHCHDDDLKVLPPEFALRTKAAAITE